MTHNLNTHTHTHTQCRCTHACMYACTHTYIYIYIWQWGWSVPVCLLLYIYFFFYFFSSLKSWVVWEVICFWLTAFPAMSVSDWNGKKIVWVTNSCNSVFSCWIIMNSLFALFGCVFHSGNLGRVDYITEFEYDLFIRPDTCNPRFRVWFNFTVENVKQDQVLLYTDLSSVYLEQLARI